MKRRVVVTGLGAITPIGLTAPDMWDAMRAGKCGVAPITRFDTADFKVKLACEAHGFDPLNYMEKKEARRMDRFCQLSMAAAAEAMVDAALNLEQEEAARCGVLVGSGIGGLDTTEREVGNLNSRGPAKVGPLLVPMMIINMAPGQLAMRYGLKGPCTCAVTACSSGTNALGDAFRLIKDGYTDVMLTGGTEATITRLAMAGFSQLEAVTFTEDVARASIPFDADRSGFVMGEGAGMFVLESLEHALARNAKIYGEIVGYGNTCDAYHMTAPDPAGDGIARAMRDAVAEAGITMADIGYLNAHGTSTPINDRVETQAIKAAFGEELAKKLPISSTKSMTGHMLGATGAIEAMAAMLALRDGFLPPTIGYRTPDADCDLHYIPNQGISSTAEYALSNTMGFGGHNASLLLKRYTA